MLKEKQYIIPSLTPLSPLELRYTVSEYTDRVVQIFCKRIDAAAKYAGIYSLDIPCEVGPNVDVT